jgi:hypothetical protein
VNMTGWRWSEANADLVARGTCMLRHIKMVAEPHLLSSYHRVGALH